MDTEFDEGSYQANFLSELVTRYGSAVISAIRTPPPRLERDLGYDAEIKIELGARVTVVFLQFKVPEVVTTRRDAECARYYGGVHYRFHLHRDRQARRNPRLPLYRQQNLLVRLRDLGHTAVYASPRFHGEADLDFFFRQRGIREQSIFIDPVEIGAIYDRDSHHISYAVTGTRWAFHSEFVPKGAPPEWEALIGGGEDVAMNTDALHGLARQLKELVEADQIEYDRVRLGAEFARDEPPGELPALVEWTRSTLGESLGSGAALVLIPRDPWGMPLGSPYGRASWEW